jgi:hypothetical protein
MTRIITSILSLLLIFSLAIVFSSSSGGRADVANDGNTGAPGEGGNVCGSCHNGGAFGPISEVLSIVDPATSEEITEYEPGSTYDVTFTVTEGAGSPIAYAFQMTALDGANDDAGTFGNPGSNTEIHTASMVANRTYVEQASSSPSNVFTVEWTAPASGTGDVTFYYVGNTVNGNGMTSGDVGGQGLTMTLTEKPGATAIAELELNSLQLFPNPVPGTSININYQSTEVLDVTMVDMTGRIVFAQSGVHSGTRLEFGDVASGQYLLILQNEGKQLSRAINVQ